MLHQEQCAPLAGPFASVAWCHSHAQYAFDGDDPDFKACGLTVGRARTTELQGLRHSLVRDCPIVDINTGPAQRI